MVTIWPCQSTTARATCRTAARAAELAPKAQVEIIPNAGHFPHKDHPERFVKILNDFVRSTSPATYSRARWRRLLQRGPAPATPLEAVSAPSA